jgi:hypothetical protein
VTEAANRLADTSPTDALRWIGAVKTADRVGVADGAGNVLQNWARSDVRAAGTWLTQNAKHPYYDQMAAAYVQTVVSTDKAAAEEWAGTIRDEEVRAKAMASTKPTLSDYTHFAKLQQTDTAESLVRWMYLSGKVRSETREAATTSSRKNPHGNEPRWTNCSNCHKW